MFSLKCAVVAPLLSPEFVNIWKPTMKCFLFCAQGRTLLHKVSLLSHHHMCGRQHCWQNPERITESISSVSHRFLACLLHSFSFSLSAPQTTLREITADLPPLSLFTRLLQQMVQWENFVYISGTQLLNQTFSWLPCTVAPSSGHIVSVQLISEVHLVCVRLVQAESVFLLLWPSWKNFVHHFILFWPNDPLSY